MDRNRQSQEKAFELTLECQEQSRHRKYQGAGRFSKREVREKTLSQDHVVRPSGSHLGVRF